MPQQVSDAPEGIEVGVVIGGRFRVERQDMRSPIGQVWVARDEKTKKTVAIQELSHSLVKDRAEFEPLREHIKTAAGIKHRNLTAVYGVGTHAGTHFFVAHEWVSGSTLSDLLKRRRQLDRPMSLRGIYNVVTHVCKGLAAVHAHGFHGTLRPACVWISKSGRVKLGELGLGLSLIDSGKWTLLPEDDQAFIAPELKTGGTGGPSSDVFGVGTLMYALLTQRTASDTFVEPSKGHPDASAELDAIVTRCLAGDPNERYGSPLEVAKELLPLVARAPEADPGDFDVDVEIDIDIATSLRPPQQGTPSQETQATSGSPLVTETTERPIAQATPPVPIQGRRVPPAPPTAPKAPPVPPAVAQSQPPAASQTGAKAPLPPPPGTLGTGERAGNFEGLVEGLLKNDTSRWMAVKDGMDHGPFTTRELIKLIVEGEVLEGHFLLNMSTNERKPLREYREFGEFIVQQRLRMQEAEHQAALEHSNQVEKRSAVAKFAVLAGAVVLVLGAGSSYLLSRQQAEGEGPKSDLDLAAMYENGNVKISGTAGILKHKPRKAGSKRTKRKAANSSGGFGSYEDAMNIAMDIGSAAKSGGERRLTSSDVAGTMNRNLNSLFSCVSQELRRGGKLGTVRIDLAIAGSGSVMGASVNAGSGAFKRCIAGKVRRIRFPSFPAPRMGARYSFDVD